MASGDSEREAPSGLSRRDLIKRGAVLGGVMWAVPIIETFDDPAFGWAHQGGSASCVPPAPRCTEHDDASPTDRSSTSRSSKKHHHHPKHHKICTWSTVAANCLCCCHGNTQACLSCPPFNTTSGSAKAKREAACDAGEPNCVTRPGPCP